VLVLDASAAVDFLLAREPMAAAIARRLAEAAPELAAPHLMDVEVAQVFRRFTLHGTLTAARARTALERLRELPLIRFEHGPLLARAWRLRENATIYDGVYIALAEGLGGVLLTSDRRLTEVPGLRCAVELAG